MINKNNVICDTLFENIQSSSKWNWTFEFDINNEIDVEKIDLSYGMIIWLHSDWWGWKTTIINNLKKRLQEDSILINWFEFKKEYIEQIESKNIIKKNFYDVFKKNGNSKVNNLNLNITQDNSVTKLNYIQHSLTWDEKKKELFSYFDKINDETIRDSFNKIEIEKEFDDKNWFKDYFIEEVNAWEFNKEKKEDLWMSIISYFYIKIVENNINNIKENNDFKSLFSKLTISNLAYLTNKLTWELLPQFKFITNTIENFSNELDKNDPTLWLNKIKDSISLFYSMKEDLKNLLQDNSLNSKYKKYILIIDDLDRCYPSEVVKLLDALKLFLDLPNLIILVAVDRRHIERWIYEVYNKNTNNFFVNPDEYLEKIIHLPIDLFSYDEKIREFNNTNYDKSISFLKELSKNTKKIFQGSWLPTINIFNTSTKSILENENVKKIINLWLSNNPRKNLRFKRILKFYCNIFNSLWFFIWENDMLEYFVFWLILKVEWWDYFEVISKNPILLYLPYNIIDSNYKSILDKYSMFFYNQKVSENKINYYDVNKLKRFISFIIYFNNEYKKSYWKIIIYFYSFQIWKNYINNSNEIWDKLLLKPLVELELFKDNNKDSNKEEEEFINRYINIIKSIYEWEIDEALLNSLKLSNFELETLKKILINNQGQEEKKYYKINEKEEQEVSEWQIELIKEKDFKNISDFNKIYNKKFNNNLLLIKNAFTNNMRMITWLWNIEEAREEDEKRFFLWSSLFFRHIVIKNIDNLLFFEVGSGSINNKQENIRNILENKIVYNDLWEKNILEYLFNDTRRTLFWEIINQMSFCKSWPSLWWMTWATDYTQFEALLIDILSIINEDEKMFELFFKLKSTIIINRDDKEKNNINLDNLVDIYSDNMSFENTNYQNIWNFFWLMNYIDSLIYLIEDKEVQNLLEKKFKRLKKRLIYVFSHFWYLQNPNTYITYYWTSRFWFKELVDGDDYWSDLKWSLLNYVSFCLNYYKYLNENYDKNLIDDIKNFVNKEEEKANLYQLLDNNENLISKEEEKNLAIDFIHTKILEHKLVFLSRYFKWEENIF